MSFESVALYSCRGLAPSAQRQISTLMPPAQLWTVCGFWACANAGIAGFFFEIGEG